MGSQTQPEKRICFVQANGTWRKMKIKLCFLVETSCKMATHIDNVQDNIRELLNYIHFYNPDSEILATLVTYYDSNHGTRISATNWTSYEEFWDNMEDLDYMPCPNDNDTEDVAGGVNFVLEGLDWSNAESYQVFHYGISPAYGVNFHEPGLVDRYPEGHPQGKNLLADMYRLSCLPCDYTFFRISPLVDTMLCLMDESYTGGARFVVEDLVTYSYISEPDSEGE